MGIKLIVEFMDHGPQLTATEWKAMVVLLEDANDATRLTWSRVTDPKIVRRIGLSDAAWTNLRGVLVRKGALAVAVPAKRGQVAKYRIPIFNTEAMGHESHDLTDRKGHGSHEASGSIGHESHEAMAQWVMGSMTPTPLISSTTSPLSSGEPVGRAAAAAGPVEEREKPAAANDPADAIVAAYTAALHRPVSKATRAKLHQQATQLLADGFPPAWLADRGRELAERGWTDLALHCERSTVPTQRVATDSRADWCGECIDPHHRLIKDPERDNELVQCERCHPAAVARRRRAEAGEAA